MTYEEKLKRYQDGNYAFNPPPVCTANWNTGDWIRWIDNSGKWLEPKPTKENDHGTSNN